MYLHPKILVTYVGDTQNPTMNFSNKKKLLIVLCILILTAIFFIPKPQKLFIDALIYFGWSKPSGDASRKDNSNNADSNEKKSSGNQLLLKSANGKLIDLESLKGKVVFLNFWATWCAPCIAEMPSINALHTEFKNNQNVVFLLVDVDGAIANSTKFMEDKSYRLPVYISAGEIDTALFHESLPTTLIFDKKGKMVYKTEGEANYNTKAFFKRISDLAAE